MKPQYLHTGKRRLINHEEFEDKMDSMVGTILLHNAQIVRLSSGLVLSDVLTFRFKVCEFLPPVGREYKQVPNFLAKKKAIFNVQNTDNRCFGYAMSSARAAPLDYKEDLYRPGNYSHLFATYGSSI